jgi:hypothetical protein
MQPLSMSAENGRVIMPSAHPHTAQYTYAPGVPMPNNHTLLPPPGSAEGKVLSVTRETASSADAAVLATRDPELIREWAHDLGAEPATGEETASGPAIALSVADGGTGLRFNFPGMSPFRGISWAEWFDHFSRYDLTFVYDNPRAGQPSSARYRIVATSALVRG